MHQYSAPEEYHELEPPEMGMCSRMSSICLKVAFTLVQISMLLKKDTNQILCFTSQSVIFATGNLRANMVRKFPIPEKCVMFSHVISWPLCS